MASVRIEIDRAAIEQFVTSSSGPVAVEMNRLGRRVEAEAKRRCPVDHGRLRASINMQTQVVGGAYVVTVGTDVEYAQFVHDGHGPIFPRSGQFLRFVPKGTTRAVFARRVRAVPGVPFLADALASVAATT